jgi:hypothetical protein
MLMINGYRASNISMNIMIEIAGMAGRRKMTGLNGFWTYRAN